MGYADSPEPSNPSPAAKEKQFAHPGGLLFCFLLICVIVLCGFLSRITIERCCFPEEETSERGYTLKALVKNEESGQSNKGGK